MKTNIKNYYRLLKGTNLIIIILSMYLFRIFILIPFMRLCNNLPFLNNKLFAILVFATTAIAAAGFIINEFFNYKIDNKNNIIGYKIKPKIASFMFYLFATIGSLAGILVAFKINNLNLGSIFIIASFAVWYYAFKYKRLLFWGNLTISVLFGFIFILPWLFEFFALIKFPTCFVDCHTCISNIKTASFIYFSLTFLIVLIYHWIKDLNYAQDNTYKLEYSISTRYGIKKAKIITIIAIIITIIYAALIQYQFIKIGQEMFAYFSVAAFSAPLLYLAFSILKAQNKNDYKFALLLSKIIIFIVLAFIVVFYFNYFNF